mgnify:CR=1 FL=1
MITIEQLRQDIDAYAELTGIPATCSKCKKEVDAVFMYAYDNTDRCWDCFTRETGKTPKDISDQLAILFPLRSK